MHADADVQVLRHPRQIARLMARLHAARALLTLVADEGRLEKHVRVLEADPGGRTLIVDALDGAGAAVLERARDIHVKVVIDGIQTWFSAPGVKPRKEQGDRYYTLPFPDALYRLQRRGAFRIFLPQHVHAWAQVQVGHEWRTLKCSIHDISTTGICFRFPREFMEAFVVGERIEHAQVNCDCGVEFHSEMEVRSLHFDEDDKTVLVGMRFIDLPPAVERMLDQAVQSLQREMIDLA